MAQSVQIGYKHMLLDQLKIGSVIACLMQNGIG